MFLHPKSFAIALCVMSFAGTTAHAATYSLNVNAFARDAAAQPTATRQDSRANGAFDDEINLNFAASTGRSTTQAKLFADPETGIVRSVTAANVRQGSKFTANSTGISSITIDEEFTAVGSGTATFNFAFDGALSAGGVLGGASFEAFMSVFGFTDTGLLRSEVDYTASTGFRDSVLTTRINDQVIAPTDLLVVDDSISLSFDLVDGQEFEFKWRFKTSSSSVEDTLGSAAADFGSTGYISFATTSGLSLTASDPNFLSNTGGSSTSPVPVPASFGFLVAALGVMGVARRRQRG